MQIRVFFFANKSLFFFANKSLFFGEKSLVRVESFYKGALEVQGANPKGGEEEFGTIHQSVSPITMCCNSKLWLS